MGRPHYNVQLISRILVSIVQAFAVGAGRLGGSDRPHFVSSHTDGQTGPRDLGGGG